MATPSNDTQMQEPPHRDASPSPPPPAPVAVTPGVRASRLQQVYSRSLAKTIQANSYANFAACFPTPAKHVPASLESVWRQLNAKLEESAKAEFDEIMRERDAVRGLNELDRLIGEAKVRKENAGSNGEAPNPIAPHTLGADDLYQAHLARYLKDVQISLDSKIAQAQSENAEIAAKIRAQRQEIELLLSNLELVVNDIDGAAKASTTFSKENKLRKESQQMDREVKARGDT